MDFNELETKLELKEMGSASKAYDETKLFSEKDIYEVSNPLARLLRFIFWKNNVTREGFAEKHFQYCVNSGIDFPTKISGRRNNNYRELRSDSPTWKKFEEFICIIMGNEIVDFSIDIKTPEGKIETCSLSDIKKQYKEFLKESKK